MPPPSASTAAWTLDTAQRQGAELNRGRGSSPTPMSQERSTVLPAPHQVAAELGTPRWASRVAARSGAAQYRPNPRRPVLPRLANAGADADGFRHRAGWRGCLLAVGDRSTIGRWTCRHAMGHRPARRFQSSPSRPMFIVVLNSHRAGGADPEIAGSRAYLSFFPVVVGMVKGLRSPGAMDPRPFYAPIRPAGPRPSGKLRLPASVAVPLRLDEGGRGRRAGGDHRGGAAHRRTLRPRRAASDRQLLRADDPDLVGRFSWRRSVAAGAGGGDG